MSFRIVASILEKRDGQAAGNVPKVWSVHRETPIGLLNRRAEKSTLSTFLGMASTAGTTTSIEQAMQIPDPGGGLRSPHQPHKA
jgi:hypothetical protein